MKIIINDINSKYLETIFLENLDEINETLKKNLSIKGPLEAKIFAINESINSHQLSKFKKNLDNVNVFSLCIYSNNRDTILAGKSLRIDSTFVKENEVKKHLFLHNTKKKDDILHEGTLRSGDRLSSNGNLCIVGDINPGAIVTAKKNIFVWGKLRGIAFAGNEGYMNASISSLYLNPLQLRIADVIAIGPKEKPKNSYPEIAVIDNQTIIIKPLLIENQN